MIDQSVSSRSPEAGVVAASAYVDGKLIADIATEEAGKWVSKPSHVVWIGLFEPSADLLKRIGHQLGLHFLAIEDAGKAHQRPKIEQYAYSLFIVARTAQMVDGRIAFGETDIFVGQVMSYRSGMERPRLTGLYANGLRLPRPP